MQHIIDLLNQYTEHCEFTANPVTTWKPTYKFDVTLILMEHGEPITLVDLINLENSDGMIKFTRGTHEVISIKADLVLVMAVHPIQAIEQGTMYYEDGEVHIG